MILKCVKTAHGLVIYAFLKLPIELKKRFTVWRFSVNFLNFLKLKIYVLIIFILNPETNMTIWRAYTVTSRIFKGLYSSLQLKNSIQWASDVAKNHWRTFVERTDRSTALNWIHLASSSVCLHAVHWCSTVQSVCACNAFHYQWEKSQHIICCKSTAGHPRDVFFFFSLFFSPVNSNLVQWLTRSYSNKTSRGERADFFQPCTGGVELALLTFSPAVALLQRAFMTSPRHRGWRKQFFFFFWVCVEERCFNTAGRVRADLLIGAYKAQQIPWE